MCKRITRSLKKYVYSERNLENQYCDYFIIIYIRIKHNNVNLIFLTILREDLLSNVISYIVNN